MPRSWPGKKAAGLAAFFFLAPFKTHRRNRSLSPGKAALPNQTGLNRNVPGVLAVIRKDGHALKIARFIRKTVKLIATGEASSWFALRRVWASAVQIEKKIG
jgi:hypothetical protein